MFIISNCASERGRLRQGDYEVVSVLSKTRDDYYMPMIRELFSKKDVPEWTLHQAANYLWNTDTPESLQAMRELFDANPRSEAIEPRLRLATVLAARGDDRGFDFALGLLRELAKPFERPKQEQERRAVETYPGRRCALPWADLFGPLRGGRTSFCGSVSAIAGGTERRQTPVPTDGPGQRSLFF